jgi:hypothetical protein
MVNACFDVKEQCVVFGFSAYIHDDNVYNAHVNTYVLHVHTDRI